MPPRLPYAAPAAPVAPPLRTAGLVVPRPEARARWALLRRGCLLVALTSAVALPARAQYTRADSLRGSLTAPARTWWDVTHYDLTVRVDPADSTLRGHNTISYRAVAAGRELQIDLQAPLRLDSVVTGGRPLPLRQEGNAWFATLPSPASVGSTGRVTAYYGGRPRIAPRPPWDGGLTWSRDPEGRPWVVTTAQGLGASVWWPNKDTQADEPDSMRVVVEAPGALQHIGAGRLRSRTTLPAGPDGRTWTRSEWASVKPINNYAIALAVGQYAHWQETYAGEAGALTMDFFPLESDLARARMQWPQALSTMRCFEHWFGPYPWYEDGYKLIQVPNNGMEHQTAVTYGNGFANGYRGRDASGTGHGMQWDFIIVHETAHEWWGNSVTTADLADMWVHESFANYSEALYTECLLGKQAGAEYARGVRSGIRNDRPIIPSAYGVNAQGSGDMYPKGGTMLHMLRQLVDDDEQWRTILRGIQSTFRHRIVTGAEVERYLSERVGRDLTKVFDQYLRDVRVPELLMEPVASGVRLRWRNVVPGFDLPVRVRSAGGGWVWAEPTDGEWLMVPLEDPASVEVDPDFYITTSMVAR
jgi:aminopeptidase N